MQSPGARSRDRGKLPPLLTVILTPLTASLTYCYGIVTPRICASLVSEHAANARSDTCRFHHHVGKTAHVSRGQEGSHFRGPKRASYRAAESRSFVGMLISAPPKTRLARRGRWGWPPAATVALTNEPSMERT